MTRGIYTTEFWLTLVTIIATVSGTLFGVLPKAAATFAVGAIVVGYCLCRGIAKRGTPSEETNSEPAERVTTRGHWVS